MAGTLNTDLAAITILDADEASGQAATPGYSVRQQQQVINQLAADLKRAVSIQVAMMPAGTAKTAMAGTITTDVS